MTQVVVKSSEPNFAALESVIMQGDLSKLTPEQRGRYVAKMCEVMGLNPLTKPFEFMTLQGKLVCYAGKNCAEQLRKVHGVSLKVTDRQKIDDVYVVTVDAVLPSGRCDSATGAVPLAGLKGDFLANAMMKAETKAKRRATLSICSLGMLDETEVETIPNRVAPQQPEETDGDPDAHYEWRFEVGQWAKKSLEQAEREDGIEEMKKWADKNADKFEKAAREKKVIINTPKWLETIDIVYRYVADRRAEEARLKRQ